MDPQKISYAKTNQFSDLICDFLAQKEALTPFYYRFPYLDEFKGQIHDKGKSFSMEQRAILVQQLQKQYRDLAISAQTQSNIDALAQKTTFTITTGHQLNLFTGPLYFLYKIIDVINLAKQLSERYPEHTFVPVYWMASEDHDFDEINHFRFFEQTYAWDAPHGGPVGRLPTNNIAPLFDPLSHQWAGHPYGAQLLDWFKTAYQKETLSEATRTLANALFKEDGLVVLDGDDALLKKAFVPIAKAELTQQACAKAINKTTQSLTDLGYHKQVHPREINLFYCQGQTRGRIIAQDNGFVVDGSKQEFETQALLDHIDAHPECISPNALLRPVYQELILPNLAYVGGGGELAYWLQLRGCFDLLELDFPMLVLRTSVLLVSEKVHHKLAQMDITVAELFANEQELSKTFIQKTTATPIDFSPQRAALKGQFKGLYDLAKTTDASFIGAVAAQEKKQLNGLDYLEKRLLRAQKRKHKAQLERLMVLRQELFPGGNLQERTHNMAQWYFSYGPDIVGQLKMQIKPLDFEFHILTI